MSTEPEGIVERWGDRPKSGWRVEGPDGKRILRVRRGDTLSFLVQAVMRPISNLLAPEAPQDITGWTIAFTAKRQDPDPDRAAICHASTDTVGDQSFPAGAAVSKSIAPAEGWAQVTMPSIATRGFPDSDVTIVFDVRGTDPAGNVFTIDFGTIVVEPSAQQFQPVAIAIPPLLFT